MAVSLAVSILIVIEKSGENVQSLPGSAFLQLHEMDESLRFFELDTGAKIPSVGLGTWQAAPGVVGDTVALAVKVISPLKQVRQLME